MYARAGYSLLADDEAGALERIEGVVYLVKHQQGRFDSPTSAVTQPNSEIAERLDLSVNVLQIAGIRFAFSSI